MRKLLLCIAIALAAIGCTKDADVTTSGDNVLTITSNIATRVANGLWESNDAIGVYITSSTTDIDYKKENVMFTTADGSGTFTSTSPLYLPSSGEVDIFAYYPWLADDKINLEAYPIDSDNRVDLLFATESNINSSSSAVALTFNHLLSKVSVTIKAGDGLTMEDLDDLVVKLSGISTTATYNLNSNELTTLNSAAELELITTITTSEVNEITDISSNAIVIPQDLKEATQTLYFTTTKYGVFSATLSTQEFKSGMEYTYTATINRTGAEITSSNINTWLGSSNLESGTANIVDIEYKSASQKYYINSAKGLAAFRDLVNGSDNTQEATFAGFTQDTENGGTEGVTFGTSYINIDGVLTQDIDLSEVCIEGGTSWSPIGSSSDCIYSGTFDGGGYKVKNLYIYSGSQLGLFGYIGANGKVYNLGVSGSVKSSSASGAWQTGGIAANNYGFIINCYSEVNVYGGTNVGGIAAYNEGNVVNCYNKGSVIGVVNNVGGIVGQNETGGYVGYCYSTGYINLEATDNRRIGGVVGYNHSTTADAPTIKGSFCIESVNTDYSIGQVLTTASSGGLTGNVCTKEYLTSESFLTTINNGTATYNLDTTNKSPVKACTWVEVSNDYPALNVTTTPTYIELDISFNSISYNINSEKGLKAFAALVNGYGDLPTGLITSGNDIYFDFTKAHTDIDGRLTDDIDLSTICSQEGTSWTPIGDYSSSESPKYSGTFDGEGCEVKNLYISSSNSYQGLFGYVDTDGIVCNIEVKGSVTSESAISQTAGIAAYNKGLIINCSSNVAVSGGTNVGGIVGLNDNGGYVVNCCNLNTVYGSVENIGGLVGQNIYTSSSEYGSLICSYNTGSITGAKNVGGCVGLNVSDGSDGGATVTSSYYLSTSANYVIGSGYGYGTANSKSESDMQALYTTLNSAAYNYNNPTEGEVPTTQACAWVAVSGGYPALDFESTPQKN